MGLFKKLFDSYDLFHVDRINTNRFSPDVFQDVLEQYSSEFTVKVIGNSIEGREIKAITIGAGTTRVLMWSQMHGDETTATRAVLDILNFLTDPYEFKDEQQTILKTLTICIVPILNPDGAEKFKRRNAINVDLNRDARKFATPEARILRDVIRDFKPNFGFNLHDQNRSYNISGLHTPSTISFLAPSFNEEEEINEIRGEAMKLIALIRDNLEQVIPKQVGLYNSDYSPRAFGDYAQEQGLSTILVESGWFPNDPEKEYVRKLNFCLLTTALDAITDGKHKQYSVHDYSTIPFMNKDFFDVLLKNVIVEKGRATYQVDIGIRHEEVNNGNVCDYYTVGIISDIGDLSGSLGFTVLDDESLFFKPGKVWNNLKDKSEKLDSESIYRLTLKGYLYIVSDNTSEIGNTDYPMNQVNNDYSPEELPQYNGFANFLLTTDSGDIKYVVMNGYLLKVGDTIPDNIFGLIF